MRLPQMTTRRWMVVVAALSIALGVYIWASRLKRRRDEFLARATWQAEQESYYLRVVTDAPKSTFRGQVAEPAPEAPAKTITVPVKTIERWLGLPESDSAPAEDTERSKAAHAIAAEMAERGRVLVANCVQRQAKYSHKWLDYHTALKRKYISAAARPWLPIKPDPPKPN